MDTMTLIVVVLAVTALIAVAIAEGLKRRG